MSDDERWSEVIRQVLDALDGGGVSDDATKDALAEGVRQALESLETGIGLDVQVLGEGFPVPESVGVQVVDGGRDAGAPRTTGDTPELRIADTDEVLPEELERIRAEAMFTHVKVSPPHKASSPWRPSTDDKTGRLGSIRLDHAAGIDQPWQTIFRGTATRLYRIWCSAGSLDVSVEGELVERLEGGQSIDVEGSVIRATTSEDVAHGTYTLIGPGPLEEE